MISIITDIGRLDLNQDTRIRFVMVNPLYSGEIGYASQSFSFAIPDSPGNRVKLGLRDITHIEDFDELVDVTLEIGGMPWQEAKLQVSTVPNTGDWSGVLYVGESRLSILMNEKNLPEYSLGGVRVITTDTDPFDIADDMVAHANATVVSDADTYDYVFFPIRNSYTFYDGKHPQETNPSGAVDDYMNYWREGTYWVESITNTTPPPSFQAMHNLVPQPYLLNVMQMVLNEDGYSLQPTAWTSDAEIQTLTLFNNYALDMRTYHQFLTQWGYINYYQPEINLQNHVPDISAAAFMTGCMRSFGLVPDFTERRLSLLTRNEIMADLEEVDWRKYAQSYQWERGQVTGQVFQSELDDDDELTGGDYLRDQDSFVIAAEVNTYADLPINATIEAADIYYVKADNGFYELIVTDPSAGTREWIRYAGRYDAVAVGDEKSAEEITSPLSTSQIFLGDNVAGTWRVPWVQMLGSSPEYGLGKNAFSLRAHFYRGMIEDDVTDGPYPQGGCDDNLGTYNYSLYWHGDNGLYEKWWKPWADYRQSARPVTYQLNLPFSEFFLLNPFKRVRVRTKDAEISGYWKQISFDIGINGIENTEMTMEARK